MRNRNRRGVGNGNDKQLKLNACMLAPAPLLIHQTPTVVRRSGDENGNDKQLGLNACLVLPALMENIYPCLWLNGRWSLQSQRSAFGGLLALQLHNLHQLVRTHSLPLLTLIVCGNGNDNGKSARTQQQGGVKTPFSILPMFAQQ